MFKLIIFVLVLYAIYIIFFKKSIGLSRKSDPNKDRSKSETMVECNKCSVFISAHEAIIKDGKFYCSNECAGV